MVDLVFITIASPMLIGVYREKVLIETIELEGKTSEVLAPTFKRLEEKYSINELCYVSGPGSFMAIKLTYVFLKTVAIVKGYKLYGMSGFLFNEGEPIPSIGKSFFVKRGEKIEIEKLEGQNRCSFTLPATLDTSKFILGGEPLYISPPV